MNKVEEKLSQKKVTRFFNCQKKVFSISMDTIFNNQEQNLPCTISQTYLTIQPSLHGTDCRDLALNGNGVVRTHFDEEKKGEDTIIQCISSKVRESDFTHLFICLFIKYLLSITDGLYKTCQTQGQGRDQKQLGSQLSQNSHPLLTSLALLTVFNPIKSQRKNIPRLCQYCFKTFLSDQKDTEI